MNKAAILVMGVLLAACVITDSLMGQSKLAQAGMKFLSVGADPRAVALGEAFTSVDGGSSSMFYNPSAMARQPGFASVMLAQTQWIADIRHNYASVAVCPAGGAYGVIGFFVQSVDYGELQATVLDYNTANSKGYLDLGTFKPTGLAFGIGYARALSEQFSVGGNVKYVRQNLGDAVTTVGLGAQSNEASVVAFDFGVLYRTGFRSLNLGMTVRNFSREVRFQQEGFQLPLTFRLGLAMNVMDLLTDVLPIDQETHALLVAVDAEHPRDFSEQIRIGAEYKFMDVLALRIGYLTPADEQGMSYGVGLGKNFSPFGLGVDYAYTPFGIFGSVHRFSFQFRL